MSEYADALDAEIATTRAQLAGLQQARDLYVSLRPARAPEVPAPAPSRPHRSPVRAALWAILARHPEGLGFRELVAAAHEFNPFFNTKTIGSLLSVAATKGELHRDDVTGRYRLPEKQNV
ncbi:MAG: hypothetical protein RJA36_1473 [Pseudomonadota bacterium]|jgi:hypothetical protein